MLCMKDYNKGLIYTEVNDCINCNKCIHQCPILESNVSFMNEAGVYKVFVDNRECILCGTCLDTCVHNARRFEDDCEAFLEDLKKGRQFSVLVAPAFYFNYPEEYRKVFGYLKSLGVKDFYSVSFGADITTWGYLNYMAKNDASGKIAQPCPAVISYIEKHQPELLPCIIPVQSPLMCIAIFLKRYKGIQEDLVFLSPCIAKKIEIESRRGLGLVRHNITFKRLMEHIKKHDVDLNSYPDTDEAIEYGMGALFSKPGGLGENIEYYLGPEASVAQIGGEHRAYKFLKRFAARVSNGHKSIPALLDILNCDRGCSHGTGTEFRETRDDDDVLHQACMMRRKKYSVMKDKNQNVLLDPGMRFARLNEIFEDLRLEDFLCEYETGNALYHREVTPDEIESIFNIDLMKYTEADKHIDCSACGYATCLGMVKAIALGINHRGNCVYYVKNSLGIMVEERRASEERMEQRLKAMLETAPLLCAIFDENFNITKVNQRAADILRLSDKQEYIDRFFDLCPEYQPDGMPSREKSLGMVKMALQTGKGYLPEWIHQTYDGEPVPVEVYLERVSLEGKNVLIVYARDLREQKLMLARLETAIEREQAASRAKSNFLSHMSHEIRTPMNAIIGMTSIAKNTGDPERKAHCLNRIEKASDHLLGIINKILDMSKIEADKFELHYHPFEFENTVVEIASVLSLLIEEKRLVFELNLDRNIPRLVISDELRLAQVITNLLTNAVKFTPEGGKVALNAKRLDNDDSTANTLRIEIADTGIGIPLEHQARLFGAFEQAEAGTTRQYGGTGLGLTISKRIIEMMGGKIWVESEPEKGSTFIFTIPFEAGDMGDSDDGGRAPAARPMETEKYGYKGHTVLVAEDVEINREIIIAVLEPTGLDVECAENGMQAVEMFREKPDGYDIIFMDLQMPQMDGLSAARQIRESCEARAKSIPIIAMTANVFQEDIDTCLAAGMNDHLGKPLDIEQVLEKVRQYLPKKDKAVPEPGYGSAD